MRLVGDIIGNVFYSTFTNVFNILNVLKFFLDVFYIYATQQKYWVWLRLPLRYSVPGEISNIMGPETVSENYGAQELSTAAFKPTLTTCATGTACPRESKCAIKN